MTGVDIADQIVRAIAQEVIEYLPASRLWAPVPVARRWFTIVMARHGWQHSTELAEQYYQVKIVAEIVKGPPYKTKAGDDGTWYWRVKP